MKSNLKEGFIVSMKKPHPCGSNEWKIIRIGLDVKLECIKCNRLLVLPRNKFNNNLKEIIKEV